MTEQSGVTLKKIHIVGKSGKTFSLFLSDVDIRRINEEGSSLPGKVFDKLQKGENVQPMFLNTCLLEEEKTALQDISGSTPLPPSLEKAGPSGDHTHEAEKTALQDMSGSTPVPPSLGKAVPSGDHTHEAEKYVWSESATKRLISLRKDFNSRFDLGRETKKSLWTEISRQFNAAEGTNLEWDQLKNKWSKLENKFKETEMHNKKSGNGRKNFAFQEEMEEAMGGNPIIRPVCTLSSADVEEVEQEQPKRKKRKNENILDFLKEMREERKEREERMMREQREVQNRKCDLMERFLMLYEREVSKK